LMASHRAAPAAGEEAREVWRRYAGGVREAREV
jgi:hypothetical protein